MFGSWNPSRSKKRFSDSGSVLCKKGMVALQGILCATSSSLIIQVWDTATDDTASNADQVMDSITLTAGQSYPIPYFFNLGLFIKVISGTGKATAFYD